MGAFTPRSTKQVLRNKLDCSLASTLVMLRKLSTRRMDLEDTDRDIASSLCMDSFLQGMVAIAFKALSALRYFEIGAMS